MPILSLCSGYGGLDMAVEALTGDKVAYVADNDEAASLLLAHHWPEVPNLGDITTYDFTQLAGLVDKVVAGFPCRNTSNAGRRDGINGEWSRVWKDVCRAVRDIRPRYAFLENVAALRSRGLDVVAEDLAAVGYDLWWTTFRASAPPVGAAHHRDRWFGIAVPDSDGITLRAQQVSQSRSGDTAISGVPGSGAPAAQDPDGPVGPQRVGAAPGEASRGGARTNP